MSRLRFIEHAICFAGGALTVGVVMSGRPVVGAAVGFGMLVLAGLVAGPPN